MIRVLDSHALMVFLEKEPGYEKLAQIFIDAVEKDELLLMTSVNYGEVCYIILRECGQEKLDEIERLIRNLPIDIYDVDLALAREAARIKAFKSISYADCFAAALAKIKKAELITGDKEFEVVQDDIQIQWIS